MPKYSTKYTKNTDTQVTATDGDKDRPQNIVYFLTGQGIDPDNPANSKFDINRTTGEIFVLKVRTKNRLLMQFKLPFEENQRQLHNNPETSRKFCAEFVGIQKVKEIMRIMKILIAVERSSFAQVPSGVSLNQSKL